MGKAEHKWPKVIPANSVVDYQAWSNGYMPPSEHALIHSLQFEGAKVVSSMGLDNVQWWFVTGDGGVDKKTLRTCIASLTSMLEMLDETQQALSGPEERGTRDDEMAQKEDLA